MIVKVCIYIVFEIVCMLRVTNPVREQLRNGEAGGLQRSFATVNGANTSITQQNLNDVYKQANTNFTLTLAPNFTFDLGTDGLEAADANLFNKYSPEMRALRDAYKKKDSLYDKKAYYVFVVPNFNNPQQLGYMVRGRAVGFVAANANVKQVTHELAHGTFGLEHTFPTITQNTSNNLMDYNNGTQLVKAQWLIIQNEDYAISWFDNDDAGAFFGPEKTAAGVFYFINQIKVAYKKNTTVNYPLGVSVTNDDTRLKAENTYLGGIQYSFIKVIIKSSYNSVDVYNKVEKRLGQGNTYLSVQTGSYISVDNDRIMIEVPQDRLSNMLYYIKNTQTFKNLILFVNGYRPLTDQSGDPLSGVEYENSTNQIEYGDSRGYWSGIDAQFMNRIGTRTAVYADGHHSVKTSNHFSVPDFLLGYRDAGNAKYHCYNKNPINSNVCIDNSYLHRSPNYSGFSTRERNGKAAAEDFIYQIGQNIVFDKQTDTLDIVAHSMGYAYAVGMIKALKQAGIKFGRFYILAPENACSGKATWADFKEVWQYGTNEVLEKPYLQDGIAPQCKVDGITNLPQTTKGGRVYIPDNFTPKGFLESHTVKNYGWIFNKTTQEDGYVKPRQ